MGHITKCKNRALIKYMAYQGKIITMLCIKWQKDHLNCSVVIIWVCYHNLLKQFNKNILLLTSNIL